MKCITTNVFNLMSTYRWHLCASSNHHSQQPPGERTS